MERSRGPASSWDASWRNTLDDIAHRLTAELPRTSDSRGEQILSRLTTAAVASVPGAEYAGLTMHDNGKLVSCAPSDPQITDVDQLQVTLGEGPCVDAIGSGAGTIITVEDFTDEPRWARFSPAVTAHGIRSLLSLAMAPHQASPATLNLYSTRPRAFDDHARDIGAAFAQQAAVAVHGAATIAGLERALRNRDEIGQAKGILIERFGLSSQQAFDLLVESSQHTNTKLSDVAHWLITETTTCATTTSRRAPASPPTVRPDRPDTG